MSRSPEIAEVLLITVPAVELGGLGLVPLGGLALAVGAVTLGIGLLSK